MPESRTKKTVRNTVWGFLEKFVQILLPFITRTLILKLIGEQYLGLNGLFTSVISVLNLADLGFGAAITYSMYKPIAENDTRTLCAILNFYKKTYRIIGLAILFVGVILMPFLPYIIKGDVPSDINIYLLYTIYLANTVLSYLLFAYDIVEGVKRVMQCAPEKCTGEDGLPLPPYRVYNIGNNNPENLLDFVTILQEELIRAEVLPSDYDFEAHKKLVPMQPGDVPITFADISALERDFGFKPSTSLREGLRKFAQWYKKFYNV